MFITCQSNPLIETGFKAEAEVGSSSGEGSEPATRVIYLTDLLLQTKDILSGLVDASKESSKIKSNNKRVEFYYFPKRLSKLLNRAFKIVNAG